MSGIAFPNLWIPKPLPQRILEMAHMKKRNGHIAKSKSSHIARGCGCDPDAGCSVCCNGTKPTMASVSIIPGTPCCSFGGTWLIWPSVSADVTISGCAGNTGYTIPVTQTIRTFTIFPCGGSHSDASSSNTARIRIDLASSLSGVPGIRLSIDDSNYTGFFGFLATPRPFICKGTFHIPASFHAADCVFTSLVTYDGSAMVVLS